MFIAALCFIAIALFLPPFLLPEEMAHLTGRFLLLSALVFLAFLAVLAFFLFYPGQESV